MQKNLQLKLKRYAQSAKGLAKPVLAGTAALAAAASANAQGPGSGPNEVYSGVLNTVINKSPGSGVGLVNFDFDGGGVDLRVGIIGFNGQEAGRVQFMQAGMKFVGSLYSANYGAWAALSSTGNVNQDNVIPRPGGAGYASIFNEAFSSGAFLNIINEPRFIGFQLASGYYGWMRIKINDATRTSLTVIDWAYKNDGTGYTPLPVELASFTARLQNGAAQLAWRTASEQNNAGFEVERSEDGQEFSRIGFVEGQGTSTQVQDYVYEDKALRQGQTYYYRLKQVDYNGQFEYSAVVSLQSEGEATAATLAPNPAKGGHTRLFYSAAQAGELRVSLFDAAGKALWQSSFGVDAGENRIDLELSAIEAGNYFVKLEQDGRSSYQKLVIQ